MTIEFFVYYLVAKFNLFIQKMVFFLKKLMKDVLL